VPHPPGKQPQSYEFLDQDTSWQNGAFTQALLDALHDPMADVDKIGLVNTNALAH
jgi:hypothetical protein